MTNALRCEASFQSGGKTYRLKFDWNAAVAFEEVAGGAVISDVLMNIAKRRNSARQLRSLLWAGLQTHHPEIDEVGAGRLIDELGRVAAMKLLGVALRYYYPEIQADAPADPPPPAAP